MPRIRFRLRRPDLSLLRRRDFWSLAIPVTAIVVVSFMVTAHFIQPAPPTAFTIAAAEGEGGQKYFAKRYAEVLAKDGIELTTRVTPGPVESLGLVLDDAAGVDATFVQAGTPVDDPDAKLVSLGSVAYAPLWVFVRGEPVTSVAALAGKRLAIGPARSATQTLAKQLLTLHGVDGDDTSLLAFDRKEAIEALTAGTIDAAFFVSTADSPAIQKLAKQPGIHLVPFDRAEAITRRLPFLTRLVLPRGVLDVAADLPPRDVPVVAPTTILVARASMHPALVTLLLRAATQVHAKGGLLHRPREFPAMLEDGLRPSDDAQRFYRTGGSLVQRWLPFWAASLVERLWLLIVPFLAIVLPLTKTVPRVYDWRVRSRIYRWYARLKEVELQLEENPPPEKLEEMLRRLDEVEFLINHIAVPLAYSSNIYGFRGHINFVRGLVQKRLGVTPVAPPAVVPAARTA